jgi:hypothetical protein
MGHGVGDVFVAFHEVGRAKTRVYLFIYSLIACNLKVMAIIQKRKLQSRKAEHYTQALLAHASVMGLFPIVSLSWSVSRHLVKEPCLLRGRCAGLLPFLLPSPSRSAICFVCFFFFFSLASPTLLPASRAPKEMKRNNRNNTRKKGS